MQKADETKQKISNAAFQLIQKQGFEATSVKQICEEAAVAYRTFYFYFPNKESVVSTFFSHTKLYNVEDFSQLMLLEGAWAKLWKAHSIYIEKQLELGPELFAPFLISTIHYPETDENVQHDSFLEMLLPLIRHAQEKGEISIQDDPRQIYFTCTQLISGLNYRWAVLKDKFEYLKEARKSLEVLYQVREDLRMY